MLVADVGDGYVGDNFEMLLADLEHWRPFWDVGYRFVTLKNINTEKSCQHSDSTYNIFFVTIEKSPTSLWVTVCDHVHRMAIFNGNRPIPGHIN